MANEPMPNDPAAEIENILRDADAATAVEDWGRGIALYRQALTFDRALQGIEAKLQWALRMQNIDALYRQGKEYMQAQRYADALAAWRKARLMYASHYKDTDHLIVEAQTAMQKQNWGARPATAQRKGCWAAALLALIALFTLAFSSACSSAPAGTAGAAAKISPAQRSNMYKSAPAMAIDVNKLYVATIKTNKGSIVVELYPKDAPQTVNNFVFLARDGFYNNLTFHRVEPGFVIQGGDPEGTGRGGPGYTLPAEIKIKHSKGAIAMARLGDQVNPKRESSGSQFYITLAATPFLDGQYTAFGQVTQGMEIVEKIARGDVIQAITIEEK